MEEPIVVFKDQASVHLPMHYSFVNESVCSVYSAFWVELFSRAIKGEDMCVSRPSGVVGSISNLQSEGPGLDSRRNR